MVLVLNVQLSFPQPHVGSGREYQTAAHPDAPIRDFAKQNKSKSRHPDQFREFNRTESGNFRVFHRGGKCQMTSASQSPDN